MLDQRPPTRHELFAVRDELDIATRAHRVLERRRDSLMFLFLDLLDELQATRSSLEASFERADAVAAQAMMREGDVRLHEVAEACSTSPKLELGWQRVAGLHLPMFLSTDVRKGLLDRGYGLLGTDAAIDETATAHERTLEWVVRVAELELVVRYLLVEVTNLIRRTNAIKHRLLPDLRAAETRIEHRLEEVEREERIRQLLYSRRYGRKSRSGRTLGKLERHLPAGDEREEPAEAGDGDDSSATADSDGQPGEADREGPPDDSDLVWVPPPP